MLECQFVCCMQYSVCMTAVSVIIYLYQPCNDGNDTDGNNNEI